MRHFVRGLLVALTALLTFSAQADISDLITLANQGDRNAQYQLAVDYQRGHNTPISQDDAFYWFQQAAEGGHTPAMVQLANAYVAGTGTDKDIHKALFWLIKSLVDGNQSAAVHIGQLYQSLTQSPSPDAMAEIWYHSAAEHNPQAEQLYAQLLEQKFNQQRARQVSSIEQLESAIDASTAQPTPVVTTTTQHQTESLMSDYLFIVLVVLVIVCLLSAYRYVKLAKRRQSTHEQEDYATKHAAKLNAQSGIVKQQKRQLETLYRELKSLQNAQANQNQDHKLSLACAMFGFHPSQLPDERSIKVRYKQLSKIYHPDMKGSEEEMKRLNGALKIIINHVNK